MFEKVNPFHPDKVADRIAGAVVDLAYKCAGGLKSNPKIAVEVMLGHGQCHCIVETSLGRSDLLSEDIHAVVDRLTGGKVESHLTIVAQDRHLADNQREGLRCGDNGIFRGVPETEEQARLCVLASKLSRQYGSDGKYILDGKNLIVCQSNALEQEIRCIVSEFENIERAIVNPLGYWTGGTDVDAGATNRKLGSDMGDAVTGGGLHGKDLSKADVSVNIVCHLLAQASRQAVSACCAIGDDSITFRYADGRTEPRSYDEVVALARQYIIDEYEGSFERFAEWGLIR